MKLVFNLMKQNVIMSCKYYFLQFRLETVMPNWLM